MSKRLLIQSICVILFMLFCSPAFASGYFTTNYRYYDAEGNKITNVEYQKTIKERDKIIRKILKEGYGYEKKSTKIEDPIKLRKRRGEQWKKYRETHSLILMRKK